MKPVEIVKISRLIPIFKEGTCAERIEVARVTNSENEELQFNIIVAKGLYKINDVVVYIMPDYCLPDNQMFTEYWRPDGDEKKCRLGKKGRVRALKFNFQFENSSDNIYSNGIILPLTALNRSINELKEIEDLQKELLITKYVAEDSAESQKSGFTEGDLPSFLYSTDENRCELLKGHINKCHENGEILGLTRKRDGSSATIFCRKNPIDNLQQIGICTRNHEKKLDQQYKSGYKTPEGVILHPYTKKDFENNVLIKGWMNDVTGEFLTNDEIETKNYEVIISEVRDSWVDTVKKHGYLDKLIAYCEKYNVQLALRGELIGAGNKGSGNKLNSDAKNSESKIVWFGVDDLSSGYATRIHYGQEHNLEKVCKELDMEYTEEIIELGGANYEGLIFYCDDYFKKIKEETGTIVEGVVIRSKFSNALSCKYINNEYDSRN